VTTDQSIPTFADANILAKPITRSLLWFASKASGYTVAWSAYAEAEANRHLPGARVPMTVVRAKENLGLSPTGAGMQRFTATKESDRQILADAAAGKAWFLVTEDVDDFAETDLNRAGVTAVHYDLFLAERTTEAGYLAALDMMASGMNNPPRTPEQLHARLGRLHPLTVTRHASAFAITPDAPTHNPASVRYRGRRCLRCLQLGTPDRLGVCERCRAAETMVSGRRSDEDAS
jgi:hypothetical protein